MGLYLKREVSVLWWAPVWIIGALVFVGVLLGVCIPENFSPASHYRPPTTSTPPYPPAGTWGVAR